MSCWIIFARNTANFNHLSLEEWNEKQSISGNNVYSGVLRFGSVNI